MANRYLGKYNDLLLFLLVIPLINTINYHLTYSNIRWDWYTYTTYFIDTAQGFVAWWIIRSTIVWLDSRLPYTANPVKRILVQILLTNVFAQAFIILATEIINAIYTDEPLPSGFYTYNLFIFFIWILVINGIYIAIYMYDQWKKTIGLRESDRQLRRSGYEVNLGKKTVSVPFSDIAAFYVDGGSTYLTTNEDKNYVLDRSLNTIQSHIPEESFYRLNRRFIVNRTQIIGFERNVNGKLTASLKPSDRLPENITISRITAPAFKKWFRATSQ